MNNKAVLTELISWMRASYDRKHLAHCMNPTTRGMQHLIRLKSDIAKLSKLT